MSDTKMKNIPIDYCDLSLWDKYEKLLNKFWRNMLKKKGGISSTEDLYKHLNCCGHIQFYTLSSLLWFPEHEPTLFFTVASFSMTILSENLL